MNQPTSPLNEKIIDQLLKSSSEPIAVINREFIIISKNNNFAKLLKEIDLTKPVNETLNISPTLINISQNFFSEALNSLVRFVPIEIDGRLEGFTIKVEKSDNNEYDEKKKKTFRAAAHDMNNILTNILNSIDLLKNMDDESISTSKLLGIIENSSNRAADIISSVLSKGSENKSYRNKINLNSLLDEISSSFHLFLPDRIKFNTNIQYGLPQVIGNYTELYRSIYNLLINAKEAIKNEGTISLSATQLFPVEDDSQSAQKVISIKISDSGIGISKENIDRIFNDSFSTKITDKVSGIGLNNVKNIIESHKGKIKVNSSQGNGTLFEIQLPVIENKKGTIVNEFKRILIAEDEDTLRELLKDLFESHEFSVTAVCDGLEVVETVKKDPYYDILIIDKKMPNMDGLDSIAEIQKLNVNIPVILATGSTSEDLKELEKEYKITHAIKKPYKFDELLGLVYKIV